MKCAKTNNGLGNIFDSSISRKRQKDCASEMDSKKLKVSVEPDAAAQVAANGGANPELEAMYKKVGGLVRLDSSPGSDQPCTSTPVENQPQDELAQKLFLGSLGVSSIPNKNSDRPKPVFLEDVELSAVVQRVISEASVSSVFELINVLENSATWGTLSPVQECAMLV